MKNTLIECVKLAGKVLLRSFGQTTDIALKQDQSNIVTEADITSERCIIDIIRSRFPGHNIIAEEAGFNDKGSKFTWIIDPLDGTSNFAAGIPWFGVLVAVFKQRSPAMAVMYLPCFDTLYFAEKDQSVPGEIVKLDITNHRLAFDVIGKIRPKTIIHTAAVSSLDFCVENKELTWQINVEGTENMAAASEKFNSKFIYISTDLIYAGSKMFYRETDTVQPSCYYGQTKLMDVTQGLEEMKEYR